jgi:hypothetical protein
MNVPALAARAPSGATKTTTGRGAEKMSPTMSRMASTSPPGVSRRMITTSAFSASSESRVLDRKRAVTLSMG